MDPKRRSTSGFSILHSRNIGVPNSGGFYSLDPARGSGLHSYFSSPAGAIGGPTIFGTIMADWVSWGRLAVFGFGHTVDDIILHDFI